VKNGDSVGCVTTAAHDDIEMGLCLNTIQQNNKTSCCSADSKWLHHCYHLPNKVEHVDRMTNIPCTSIGREISPKTDPSNGGILAPTEYIPGHIQIQTPNGI